MRVIWSTNIYETPSVSCMWVGQLHAHFWPILLKYKQVVCLCVINDCFCTIRAELSNCNRGSVNHKTLASYFLLVPEFVCKCHTLCHYVKWQKWQKTRKKCIALGMYLWGPVFLMQLWNSYRKCKLRCGVQGLILYLMFQGWRDPSLVWACSPTPNSAPHMWVRHSESSDTKYSCVQIKLY